MNIPKSNSVPAIIISDFDDENVLAKRKSLEVTKKNRTETSQAEPSDEEVVQVQEKCEIFVKKDISGVGEKSKTTQKVGPCTIYSLHNYQYLTLECYRWCSTSVYLKITLNEKI